MQRIRIRSLLASQPSSDTVRTAGWVRTRRDSKGGFSFLELNDGSCLANLQVIADQTLPNYAGDLLRLHPGASVAVEGVLIASTGRGQVVELKASAVRVLGLSEVPEAGGDGRVMPDEVRRDDVITLGVITLSLK